MELTGWRGTLYRYMDWGMKLAYVNILWLVGTVIGLGILGFFPATVAMLTIIRKWSNGEEDIKSFTLFREIYKKEFLKSNLFGYIWVIIGIILFVDLQFFRSLPNIAALIASFFFFILGVIYLIALLYAFPLYVGYQMKLIQYFKDCIYIVLSNPLFAIFMVLGFYFPYYLMMKIPGLIPFYGGSLIGVALIFISNKMFQIIESKQKHNINTAHK
ncbi:YesL family protein [Psychrobacillus sp. FSL K6-2843]|uniref:YesL family protein n=1 Tax=Psychrobacillus sp. FSL K6-2843 TaxID=2921549 RepID=UPI00315A20A6